MMTWGHIWSALRYRLFVLGLMAVTLGAFAVALRSSVHLGEPPPYDAPYMHEYVGAVTTWSKGQAGLGGWVANQSDRDCPSVVVWVQADQMDPFTKLGPIAETNGFVGLGPVRAHQRTIWAGYRIAPWGQRAPLDSAPRPDANFICYR